MSKQLSVEIICSECGHNLECTDIHYLYGELLFSVKACPVCTEKVALAAEEDGKQAEILATSRRVKGGR